MPRRNVEQAYKIAEQRLVVKVRCMVRHPEFYDDMVNVRRNYLTDKNFETYFAFLQKWDLKWFPSSIFMGNGGLPKSPQYYERAVAAEVEMWSQSPYPDDEVIVLPAVVARDPFDEYMEQFERGENPPKPLPDEVPKPGRLLKIIADLSYPRDILEKIIAAELKSAHERRAQLQALGALPKEPERIHIDNLSFCLEVYDQANAGKTYSEIAETFDRSKSSIQHADMVARRLIGDARSRRQTWGKVDRDAYVKEHFKRCELCRRAERFADQCDGFKSWASVYMVATPIQDGKATA
jgi:hypothetical protein